MLQFTEYCNEKSRQIIKDFEKALKQTCEQLSNTQNKRLVVHCNPILILNSIVCAASYLTRFTWPHIVSWQIKLLSCQNIDQLLQRKCSSLSNK